MSEALRFEHQHRRLWRNNEPLHHATKIGNDAIVKMLLFRLRDFKNSERRLSNALGD